MIVSHDPGGEQMDEREYEDVEWFSKVTGTPQPTVYRWAAQDLFPLGVLVRLGRRVKFNTGRTRAWLAAGGSGFAGGWKRSPGHDSVSGGRD